MIESQIRRLLGAVKVYEQGDLVHIEGLSTAPLINGFYNIWNTIKITDNMFTHVDSSSLSFNKFFVPDMVYSLSVMAQQKPRGVNLRAINKIIELLKTNTWYKSVTEGSKNIFNWKKIKNVILEPLKHQDEFFRHYESNVQRFHLHGFLLAAAPGSGKTAMCLMMGELIGSDVNIVIVPKNSIDLVWKKSFETLYVKETSYWVSSMDIDPPKGCRNYAFHYERLEQAIEFCKKNKFKNPLLWVDESHNLNEMVSARTQLFIELADLLDSNNVVWASGTPIKAMGREVIPLLRTIDPYFNKDAEERFTQVFGKAASRALDILNNRIGMVMHLTTKAEFQDRKPITEDIKVIMPNGDKYTLDNVRIVIKDFIKERTEYYEKHKHEFEKLYFSVLDHFEKTLKSDSQKQDFKRYNRNIAEIRKGYDPKFHKEMAQFCNQYENKTIAPTVMQPTRDQFKKAKTVVKYVNLVIIGEALGRVVGKMREQCIVDMIPYANLPDLIDSAENKTLIFSTYVSALKESERVLKQEGYLPLLVYGDTNKDLTGIVKKFTDDEDVNPLVATYASLSAAVPLTMANVCILLNSPFRDYIKTQATSRVDRIGQPEQVYIYNLFLDTGSQTNLSTRAGDILAWCKETVAAIIGTPVPLEEGDSVTLECFNEPEFNTPLVTRLGAPLSARW